MAKSTKRSIKKHEKLVKLYDVSLKIFAKYGYKKATLEDIAKELGITKGNIYRYVESKQDLYERAVLFAIQEFQDSMEEAVMGIDDSMQQIITLSMHGYKYFSENSELQAVLADTPEFILNPSVFSEKFYEVRVKGINIVKKVLENGIQQKLFRNFEIDCIAELLYNFYGLFIINSFVLTDFVTESTPSKMFSEIVNLVLYGILNTKNENLLAFAAENFNLKPLNT